MVNVRMIGMGWTHRLALTQYQMVMRRSSKPT